MITQRVSSKKVSPLQGIAMVVGIVLVLMVATAMNNVLAARVDRVWGQIAVLLLAGLGAFYLMRTFILEFQYTVSGSVFYIERIYGQRTKVMLQVPLSDVLFMGDPKAAAQRWPGIRIMVNATLKRTGQPCVAFAYRKDGQMHLALVQADGEIRAALFNEEERKRSAQEKWG